MNHRPKLRDKTIKLLQENMGEYLHDLGLEEGFLNRTKKAPARIENDKISFTELTTPVHIKGHQESEKANHGLTKYTCAARNPTDPRLE